MNKPEYLRFSRKGGGGCTYAIYKCGCGKEFEARLSNINRGQLSCGCAKSKPPIKIKHGRYGTPAYSSWDSMMTRCYSAKSNSYSRYGGRGITVCEEWHDVTNFCDWAEANGCEKGIQIDRIDNNGNYSPENCRYITCAENSKNRSGTYWWHTPEGVFSSLKESCEHYGKWIAKRFDRVDMPEYFKVKKYEDY